MILYILQVSKFYNTVEINDDICIVQMKHESVLLDRQIYAGSDTLDLSKTLMYNFHYHLSRGKFVKDGEAPELCYIDTESIIYNIPMSSEERQSHTSGKARVRKLVLHSGMKNIRKGISKMFRNPSFGNNP